MNSSLVIKTIKNLSPAQALVFYYALAILIGSLLLATPWAAHGTPLSLLDALFTATSAQCVTGLIVVDTGTKLTLFGQCVVLVLIQIGGLGIMTFSVYLFIYLKVGVSSRGRWIIHETLMHSPVSSWRELIRGIFLLTLGIEAVGALLLAFAFVPVLGFWDGIYSALFHSISAFCNAGFSLFSDSLVGFRDNPLVNLTVMALIILGGIGFLVIRELIEVGRTRSLKRSQRPKLSLHTKIVLVASSFLIVYGALMIAWLEGGNALAGMPFMEGFWTALFQSVTARTAGFNTIDLNAFRAPTVFLVIFLMFVGASPGSAGGGVKTTSMALFFAIFYSRLKGNQHTSLFRRTIPEEVITKGLALVLLAIILIALALFGLMIVQSSDLAHENMREFLGYTFEAFSAFGTVGLSIGATAKLNPMGKLIIILLMFVGRVGLLTMAFAIAGRVRRHAPRYAEENIMIG
ncbi:TrkH family potassium uptake protein [Desulfuromonas carbonis]|uniref:TrkH family potassium uptake protein n=1 Tax=Desulfuromonas sp. DDH964 TaxID=1823759 RepID=UPI00078C9428|nr:TrkH family potassium uptake protein [Desulfuromonas sp. DDH964]AMV70947.1 Ktr system potassium uptake protein B [Desulfuromonas sp. DDH964]